MTTDSTDIRTLLTEEDHAAIIAAGHKAAHKSVIVIGGDGYTDNGAFIAAAMKEQGHTVHVVSADDTVPLPGGETLVLTTGGRDFDNTVHASIDPGRPVEPHRSGGQRTVYKGGGVGLSSMQSIAIAATLAGGAGGEVQSLTGRSISKRNSAREEERRQRLRQLREQNPEPVPVEHKKIPTTQHDHDCLAAAQAKRDRRAAKKGIK